MFIMAEAEKTTNTYPYRPPKKYPQKDLHGRVRFGRIFYHDFERAQKFFVNVFGWDMIDAVILVLMTMSTDLCLLQQVRPRLDMKVSFPGI